MGVDGGEGGGVRGEGGWFLYLRVVEVVGEQVGGRRYF